MLTVAEIADRLRVEHKTVRALIKAGKLRAVRLAPDSGGRLRGLLGEEFGVAVLHQE